MGKVKSFLTVYTVTMTDVLPRSGLRHIATPFVIGSYISRGDAIRECADYILGKLERDPELRGMFLEGEHGKDIRNVVIESGLTDEDCDGLFCDNKVCGMEIPDKVKKALRPYLVDCIGGDGCYVVGSGCSSGPYFRFDVDENDVECRDGLQLWTCIRSGRDDEAHDPEFENAFPEVFLSEAGAVKCAIDDLKGFLDGYSSEEARIIVSEAKERLSEYGHFEFDSNNTHTVYWDIWSTPLDIGQGSGKTSRCP